MGHHVRWNTKRFHDITASEKKKMRYEYSSPVASYPTTAVWQLQPEVAQTVQQHVSYELIGHKDKGKDI